MKLLDKQKELYMQYIVLKNSTENNIPLEATFAPLQGMNLLSFKKGDVEALDQTTKGLFIERYAGLGALIGPHFIIEIKSLSPLTLLFSIILLRKGLKAFRNLLLMA